MTLSRRILIGLILGIVVGLFLGDRAAFLDWPAKAFVQLLGVTVLPYLVTSLVVGIAHGTPAQARRLAARGGVVIAVLWALSLLLVFVSPLALPADKGGAFYAVGPVAEDPQIDWLDLYIPANPFHSLANNVVPAVVVFSVLLGIALLGLANKERILSPLRLLSDVLGRAGELVVQLTPFGIFAMAGHAAGTLRVEELERLQAFLYLSIGLLLLLTLWLLPGLISAVTRAPYRRVLGAVWDPLITAFVTSNLFVVLPLLQERAKQLLAEGAMGDEETEEAIDVLVPTSFTFPHSAKLLSLVFILFAGWFSGAPVAIGQYAALAVAGLLSLFGSLNTAVPFLLDVVRLPADLFQLFILAGVVNSHFGSAAAAMHTFAVAVLGAFVLSGRVRFDVTRLTRFAVTSAVVLAGFLIGSRMLLSKILPGPEGTAVYFDQLKVSGLGGRLAPAGSDAPPASPPVPGRRLDEIRARQNLRACVSPDAMPWCYRNNRGEIVGLEVDMAQAMAVDLNVGLTLVPVDRLARNEALASGACDMATGRIMPSEATAMAFSHPLAEERWAFLTLDHERDVYASVERIRALEAPKIAVLRVGEWIELLKLQLPNADVIPIDTLQEFIDAPPGRFDATFTGFDRAAAYSLVHPRFSAVLPAPSLGSVPLAILVPRDESALRDFANAVIEVAHANGTLDARLAYWIGGEGIVVERRPRWSIGRDVFGWWQ